jgi:hypothetical protein
VLFSSITSATGGGPGQVDHCAANAFLDARTRHHQPAIAISWGEWQWDALAGGGFRAFRKKSAVTSSPIAGTTALARLRGLAGF